LVILLWSDPLAQICRILGKLLPRNERGKKAMKMIVLKKALVESNDQNGE
jgi:hypothetical protein